MENNFISIIKPSTPGELAGMYGVSLRTFNTWIKMHFERIGQRRSRYYTALQVKIIYDCIGVPNSEYRD